MMNLKILLFYLFVEKCPSYGKYLLILLHMEEAFLSGIGDLLHFSNIFFCAKNTNVDVFLIIVLHV